MKKGIQQGLHVGFDVAREEEGMWIEHKNRHKPVFVLLYHNEFLQDVLK